MPKKLGSYFLKKGARQHALIENAAKQKAQNTCKTDLSFKQFIELVNPQFKFYTWNLILISRLQEVADGKLTRLLVQVPPRHGKSELCKLFGAYYLLRYQNRFVGVTSYSMDLAVTFSRASRAYYAEAGGKFNPESQSVQFWETEQRAGMWCAGSGGSITGKGASLCISDDAVKGREEAESEAYIRRLHDWYKSTLRTRINPEDGAIVVVQTRWSQTDLIGLCLDLEDNAEIEEFREGWHIIDFPALYEEQRPYIPNCVTVEEDWRTTPGVALCPERYNEKALGQIRSSIGSREFGSLYQQNPQATDAAIFKPSWWRYRKVDNVEYVRKILSVDCAFTATAKSDYVAIAVLGERDDGTYDIIDIVNERIDVIGTMSAINAQAVRHNPQAVLVEAAANGHAVIQMMRKKLPNIVPIKPDKSKVARASGAAPLIEAGSVYLPPEAHWLHFVVDQFSSFPTGSHDDAVDAITQALNWLRDRTPQRFTTVTWGRSDHAIETRVPLARRLQ